MDWIAQYNPVLRQIILRVSSFYISQGDVTGLETCGGVMKIINDKQGPVVPSIVSLTSSFRVDLLNVAKLISSMLIYFAEKCAVLKSHSHFYSKMFYCICIKLDKYLNVLLTNDIVNFEQQGPVWLNK